MSYSNLTSQFIPASSSNYTKGRNGYKICKITPHHMAGKLTAVQCANIFANPARQASSNYGIGYDGEIVCYVEEENRSWCSANRANDFQAITIEVSNSANGTDHITEASWNALVELCVDICKRYNFRLNYDGTPNGSLTRHNMFQNTNCPGTYLQGRFPELVELVNAKLDGQPTPQPIPQEPNYTGKIIYQAYTDKWLPEVDKCDNTSNGYAGIGNKNITGFRCKPTYGEIIYQAHILGGDWLPEVNSKGYSNGSGNSYAGIIGKPIDAIKIKSTKGYVDYRVKTKKGWLPWVRQYNDYAGNFGETIFGIQMK